MNAPLVKTLEQRIDTLLFDRAHDAVTSVRVNGRDARDARDEWLRSKLSEQDFKEYWQLMYFGPAGDKFPNGWFDAELMEESDKLHTAYRQGVRDGARLLMMMLGIESWPGERGRQE